jgi:hypothetical protein
MGSFVLGSKSNIDDSGPVMTELINSVPPEEKKRIFYKKCHKEIQ